MARNSDWFRKETWTEEDKKEFFTKLNRVRSGRSMQAQYVRLKAAALAYTKKVELIQGAEDLLNHMFTEYSENENRVDKSAALHMLGDIYKFRGNIEKALNYYKQAINFEAIFPNVITNSFMDYAELVVKTNRIDLFDDVEKIFTEERYGSAVLFPLTKYLKYSILSIISKHKNDTKKAKYYSDLANENAEKKQSGLNNHKTLGLVRERDKILDELVGSNER